MAKHIIFTWFEELKKNTDFEITHKCEAELFYLKVRYKGRVIYNLTKIKCGTCINESCNNYNRLNFQRLKIIVDGITK